MTAQSAAAVPAAELAPEPELAVAAAEEDGEPEAPGAQPAIDIRPALIAVNPASFRTWRRSIRVARS